MLFDVPFVCLAFGCLVGVITSEDVNHFRFFSPLVIWIQIDLCIFFSHGFRDLFKFGLYLFQSKWTSLKKNGLVWNLMTSTSKLKSHLLPCRHVESSVQRVRLERVASQRMTRGIDEAFQRTVMWIWWGEQWNRKALVVSKLCNTWSRFWWDRWWKKSCTTWDVEIPVNSRINYLSTGAGFQPSTGVLILVHYFFTFKTWWGERLPNYDWLVPCFSFQRLGG